MNKICAVSGHDFPTLEAGQKCENCGIIYCPVAYDHNDWSGDGCGVCGWDGNA